MSNGPAIEKTVSPGLQVAAFSRPTCREFFVTAVPVDGEALEVTFEKAAAVVRENDAGIISQEVFGLQGREGEGRQAFRDAFGQIRWPVTWVEPEDGIALAGTQLWAVSGLTVDPIRLDGKVVGTGFDDGYGRYCRLGDMRPAGTDGTVQDQARETFGRMEAVLQDTGMEFAHVMRTWFCNDAILSWYGDFNRVRNTFFSERGVFAGLVPASTGIGGRNPAGTALVGGLLALEAKDENVQVVVVPSPFQGSALEYGSSFSRAVEVAMPGHRRLFISGTAGIEPGGGTAHVDNVDGQVELAMDIVAAILESRGMAWSDVVRAVAYFRYPEDTPAYTRFCTAHALPSLPVVVTNNVICRDDLLYEVEVDAIRES